jgi:addiction module HigA family antidote
MSEENPTRREWQAQNPGPFRPWMGERRPSHPGDHLKKYCLDLEVTQEELAKAIGMSRVNFNGLLNGRNNMTVDVALRLSKVIQTTPEFWLNLQRECDLWDAKERLEEELEQLRLLPSVEARLDEPMFETID